MLRMIKNLAKVEELVSEDFIQSLKKLLVYFVSLLNNVLLLIHIGCQPKWDKSIRHSRTSITYEVYPLDSSLWKCPLHKNRREEKRSTPPRGLVSSRLSSCGFMYEL